MNNTTSASVTLLRFTTNPVETVALAAKICYSSLDGAQLVTNIDASDNNTYIRKLFELGHLSPFEHASFSFLIEGVSRALLAQITRHRIASFSVRSQRYVDGSDFAFVIPPSIAALGDQARDKFVQQMQTTLEWYREWQDLLGGAGERANEDARFVLPNAVATQMVVTMNARELLHFFNLRCCNRAQWELRAVAWEMLRACQQVAPAIFDLAGPTCLVAKCPEGRLSCGRPYKKNK